MRIFKLTDPDFRKKSLRMIGFNENRSLIYCYCISRVRFRYADYLQKFVTEMTFTIYRICVFGQSVHEIAEIVVPCDAYPMFDVKNEEIVWLGKVKYPRSQVSSGCLLTLVTFDLRNGVLKRFYHIHSINRCWELMRKMDDLLLAFPIPWNDHLDVYAVSYLDPVNGTFGLTPFLRLPFYKTLQSAYHFSDLLASSKNRITIIGFPLPGEILYFEFGKGWVRENYYTEPTEDDFEIAHTCCGGRVMVEEMKNDENENFVLRFRKPDKQEIWQLIFHVSIPKDVLADCRCRFSADCATVAYLAKCQNSTLKITIRSCDPCTLLEACISSVWPRCRQTYPWLTDYEIGKRLKLSKLVDMDVYFGKVFSKMFNIKIQGLKINALNVQDSNDKFPCIIN